MGMRDWDLRKLEAEPRRPQILASGEDARSVLLALPAGEELQEHEVHERARVVVVEGEVEVSTAAGESVSAAAGHLFEFDPAERHTVAARTDTRLLLVLSPWPGDGHPGAMTLDEKADVRQRAAEAR